MLQYETLNFYIIYSDSYVISKNDQRTIAYLLQSYTSIFYEYIIIILSSMKLQRIILKAI